MNLNSIILRLWYQTLVNQEPLFRIKTIVVKKKMHIHFVWVGSLLNIIQIFSRQIFVIFRLQCVWLGPYYSFSRTGINLIFLHFENCIPCISRIKLIICNSKIRLFPNRYAKMQNFSHTTAWTRPEPKPSRNLLISIKCFYDSHSHKSH